MSTDTDSSTDSSSSSYDSSSEYKKRELSKKRKHKIEKKQKKKKSKNHKKKKHSKKESKTSFQRPPPFETNENCFGPSLPPHLQQKSETTVNKQSSSPIIGPVLPILENVELQKQNENDESVIGPLPLNTDNLSAVQVEREKRALELKIAVLEGRSLQTGANKDKTREEWMLELPEVGLRGGLAALSNIKRTFHTGKEKPDFSDRSAWTKNPQSESMDQSVMNPKVNAEDLRSKAQDLYEHARDVEQEKLAKKHKIKHKRDESLMELHQKKLRKAEKQKEKELAASGSKPERRPFSRDIDLKLNKIDKNQTKQIVDKAKILNSKFSTGKTKYL